MNQAPIWTVVPVKPLEQAKQRLKAALPPAARRKLMLVMLEDVLATLRQVPQLQPVLVVTPDAAAAQVAEDAGAMVLRETSSQGHSAAAIAGFAHAQARGAARALTLPADAPLVTAAELHSLIEAEAATAGPHLTLVPSHDGDGTNGFLVSPPDLMQPSFGPGSFARHLAHAAARGIECHVRNLSGLALDIDEPDDLTRLMAHKRGSPRYEFLRERRPEMTTGSEAR
jgi:2-phospho-L-lactate/phosphoenolpyruvate guanylyltransferase